jgi:ankyrin repeat protein
MAGDLSSALEFDPRLVRKHSPDAWTLLHLATRFDQVETARILLARGADPQARSSQGGLYPIHLASSAAMLRLLTSHGADINARTKQQASLLHYAVMRDDPEFVALLVSLGADPRARTRAGQTPWAVAVRYGKRRAADSLLRGPV